MNLVNAQQARRILDRIVGYKLSPLLWKKIKSGLSAGRVQSVVTRIIVDREEEIKGFVPDEYWTITVMLKTDEGKIFAAKFYGDGNGKIKLTNEAQTMSVVNAVTGKPFTVKNVKKSVRHKSPAPPFTTSTMQQDASRKLKFQSQKTMKVAQELYEGINVGSENGGVQGLITYMRTDSLRISADAQAAARDYIVSHYGENYYPSSPRVYKTKNGAQDAHEAIRPSKIELDPNLIKKYLTNDQYKLYKLIWDRFTASQMQSADISALNVDFENSGYIFRTGGYTVTFPGYMVVYEAPEDESKKLDADEPEEIKDIRLPAFKVGEKVDMDKILPDKHFTEPPARYNESTLIKFMEEKGIGRPSTYAPTISTIIAREYVRMDGRAFVPTELGEMTTNLMKDSFSDIVDCRFTAKMETRLDSIEEGTVNTEKVLADFWKGFEKQLSEAEKNIEKMAPANPVVETDIVCEKCGSKMVVKKGRFGEFAACPNFPKCRNTKPLNSVQNNNAESDAKTDDKTAVPEIVPGMKCEKCGGDMVLRQGRYGSFYACVNYPRCKYTKQKNKELDVACPECGGKVVVKYSKSKSMFYCCDNYPKCTFSSWDLPLNEICPRCGKTLFRKKGKALTVCHNKECGYEREEKTSDTDE